MAIEILVFRTFPDSMNTNYRLSESLADAFRHQLPDIGVGFVSSDQAIDAIEHFRPKLAMGIGSVIPDSVDYSAIARAAHKAGATSAIWLHDDPYEFDFSGKVVGQFDAAFTNDRAALDYYDPRRVSHLPMAADARRHFRKVVPLDRRAREIFFCGHAYANRRDLIYALRKPLSARDTAIFGSNWNTLLPFCKNERMGEDQLMASYADAMITLNIGRQFNIANRAFEIVPSTPGPRTFEAAAAGALQLCFLESLELFDYFECNSEVLWFDSPTSFVERVDYVLSNPGLATEIARRSQDRALRDHTYDVRVQAIIRDLTAKGMRSLSNSRSVGPATEIE